MDYKLSLGPERSECDDSLLDLVAAVGAREADDELQLFRGVVHELALKAALLGLGGPCESLVHVEQAVERGRQGDQLPAHRFIHLKPG